MCKGSLCVPMHGDAVNNGFIYHLSTAANRFMSGLDLGKDSKGRIMAKKLFMVGSVTISSSNTIFMSGVAASTHSRG